MTSHIASTKSRVRKKMKIRKQKSLRLEVDEHKKQCAICKGIIINIVECLELRRIEKRA